MPESRLDLDDALQAILADTSPVAGSEVTSTDVALGRVVAQAVDAPVSLPPFPASAMDGYAVRSRETTGSPPYRFALAGTSYAGGPATQPTPKGACVRIFTGAPVPPDLDTVIIQEDCEIEGDAVVVREPFTAGDNVRPTGHDVAAGARLLNAGTRITAFHLGWLAACGITRIRVRNRPKVGIFSTGDELVEPGGTLRPGQIFDANRLVLRALLLHLPVQVVDFAIVGDDPRRIREVLEAADHDCEMIITSGGVSVGEADWVRAAVEELGTIRLWKLNLKPGKPLAYGRLRRSAFFGLPGNPVSTIVTALMLVKPALDKLCGAVPAPPLAVPALLRGELRHRRGREEFQRGTLQARNGILEVTVTGDQSSNRLSSFALANCLIRIPKDCSDLTTGSQVSTLPFWGVV